MVIKRNIFLILVMALSLASYASASTRSTTAKSNASNASSAKSNTVDTRTDTANDKKSDVASSVNANAAENNKITADTSQKLNTFRAKKKIKSNQASNNTPNIESVSLNLPSPKDKEVSYSSDWLPQLNKDPTDASKNRLKEYEQEQEKLVDELLGLKYNTYTPPKQLYNRANTTYNKHLPPVYLKSDYFDMAFKAVETDDEDALRAVLSGSSFLNQQNKNGDTILIYAIQNRGINSARILLAKGALTDIANHRQRTALHYASSLGDVDSVKLLLSMGASLNVVDDMNMTPLDYAKLEKRTQVEDIIKYLEAK